MINCRSDLETILSDTQQMAYVATLEPMTRMESSSSDRMASPTAVMIAAATAVRANRFRLRCRWSCGSTARAVSAPTRSSVASVIHAAARKPYTGTSARFSPTLTASAPTAKKICRRCSSSTTTSWPRM